MIDDPHGTNIGYMPLCMTNGNPLIKIAVTPIKWPDGADEGYKYIGFSTAYYACNTSTCEKIHEQKEYHVLRTRGRDSLIGREKPNPSDLELSAEQIIEVASQHEGEIPQDIKQKLLK